MQILSGEPPLEDIKQKAIRLDILAQEIGGKRRLINVEMQKNKKEDYVKRMELYASRLLQAGLKQGQSYGETVPVVSVSILDHSFRNHPDTAHSLDQLKDRSNNVISDSVEYHYIELIQKPNELNQELSEWIKLLKVKQKGELSMFAGSENRFIADAARELQTLLASPEEREKLQAREDGLRDYMSDIQATLEKERKRSVFSVYKAGIHSPKEIANILSLPVEEVNKYLSKGDK